MADYISIDLYGNMVEYKCLNCGEIMKFHESTIEIMKENDKEYIFCECCDNKIKLRHRKKKICY